MGVFFHITEWEAQELAPLPYRKANQPTLVDFWTTGPLPAPKVDPHLGVSNTKFPKGNYPRDQLFRQIATEVVQRFPSQYNQADFVEDLVCRSC